jgi:MYXO-CTERM domain-containing protein
VRDLAESYDLLRSHIDLHSFGQLVLYPWGWTEELAPADDVLSAVAGDMAEVMSELGVTYTPLMGTMLYPAAGNATDWFYGELGAYAFTYELRPMESEEHDLGFVLPPEEIRDVCVEAIAGLTVLAEFTISAAPGMPGDDGNAETDGWESTGVATGNGDATGSGSDEAGPGSDTTAPGTSTSPGSGATTPSSSSSTTALGSGSTSGEGSEDDGAGSNDATGCGCRSTGSGIPLPLVLLPALLVRRRRTSAPDAR